MNVLILTEGGKRFGYGHISRCLALHEAFEELHCRISWIMHSEEDHLTILEDITNITYVDWINHPADAIKQATNVKIAVIDSYLVSQELLTNFSEIVSKLVFIDDYKRISYPEGIIVNGSPGAWEINYNQSWNFYLLGPDYAMLRKEFWENNLDNGPVKEHVLFIPGSNMDDQVFEMVSKQVLEQLDVLNLVVLGGQTHLDDSRIKHIPSFESKQLKNLMAHAAYAITAGGQILHELAAMGVPTLVFETAESHRFNIKAYESAGFIINAGRIDETQMQQKFIDALVSLSSIKWQRQSSEAGQELVDGQGARRVVSYVMRSVSQGYRNRNR